MTLSELIQRQRDALSAILAERTAQTAILDEIRDASADRDALTADETARSEAARTARAAIDVRVTAAQARIADLEAELRNDEAAAALANTLGRQETRQERQGGATVTREPRTYTAESARRDGFSFFRDALAASQGEHFGDGAQRLQRHMAEHRAELQQRAITTTVAGGLVPPQYLVDLVALPLRNGRPFANSIPSPELPVEGMSLIIPRITGGVTVATQATQNTSVSSTDIVETDLTVPVVTVAGQQDVSRQLIERGYLADQIVFADLAAAYAAELDRQCIAGSGSSGQALGLQNTAGINAATLFGAAPTVSTFQSKVAGQIAAISGAGTAVTPTLIVMHPRRWGWLQAQVDTTGRPLVPPLANGPYNASALNLSPGSYSADGAADGKTVTIVGQMLGLPIITDANVPTAVGTESEDLVFVLDNTKALLWENGSGGPETLRFEQTLGNQLTVKLVAYGYFAFTAGRLPASVGKVGGLDTGGATFGLVAPTF